MQSIERHIIAALVRDMAAKGYKVAAFWDGEAYQMPGSDGAMTSFEAEPRFHSSQPTEAKGMPQTIKRAMTEAEALEAVNTVDEGTLHFTHHHKRTWGNRGVFIVLGNGEDCISDYHAVEREPFCEIIEAIYDRISNGKLL